jgi:hypothetical protein
MTIGRSRQPEPDSAMTQHDAAATHDRRMLDCWLSARTPGLPANDNADDLTRNGMLHAALKHFAEHGLGAAEVAQRNAERAYFAGDRKEYRHWLDICRALDRRMAEAVRFRAAEKA